MKNYVITMLLAFIAFGLNAQQAPVADSIKGADLFVKAYVQYEYVVQSPGPEFVKQADGSYVSGDSSLIFLVQPFPVSFDSMMTKSDSVKFEKSLGLQNFRFERNLLQDVPHQIMTGTIADPNNSNKHVAVISVMRPMGEVTVQFVGRVPADKLEAYKSVFVSTALQARLKD